MNFFVENYLLEKNMKTLWIYIGLFQKKNYLFLILFMMKNICLFYIKC